MKEKPMFRYFMAILLVGLGGMLILGNIGVIESDVKELWHYVYPTFFVVYGIVLLVRYFRKINRGWMFASFLIIFGTLLLAGRLDMIDYQFKDIFKLWPLLIIYAGFSVFGESRKYTKSHKYFYYGSNGEKGKKHKVSQWTVGDHEFTHDNWRVKPMNLRNLAGNYYFNFSKAFIPDEEIPIVISSLAGDVQIILPESLEFRVYATVKAGEINVLGKTAEGINRVINFETAGYEEAVRKLDFNIDLKAGSIRIDQA